MFPKFLLVLAVYAVTLGVVGDLVNNTVVEPYMDEIFHIPQAQRYCDGNFTQWDNKITTLPGLYLFSVGLLDPAYKMSTGLGYNSNDGDTFLNFCSVKMLRSVNLLMSIINIVLLYTITSHLHGLKESYSDSLGIWSSVNMSMMPVLYMTSYLYYTDQVSTAMVLLTLCLHLSGQDWLASFSGVLAILCRQTNIVWVFLCGGLAAGNILVTEVRLHQASTKHPPTISLTTSGQIKELIIGVCDIGKTWKLMRILGLVMVRCGGYVMVAVMFLMFVHYNNGVVVGDRSAHVVTLHLTQLGYFAAFFTFLTLPFALKNVPDFLVFVRQNLTKVMIVMTVTIVIIHYNTLAHPYLLADNRHYTFYIWRRIMMRHWTIKYLASPVYMFGMYHAAQCLAKSDLIFKILLPLCVFINIVPQLLLEFRYYIIPFLLIRSQLKPNCWRSLAIESVLIASINFMTIYIFLFKPFSWEQVPDKLQRFMW